MDKRAGAQRSETRKGWMWQENKTTQRVTRCSVQQLLGEELKRNLTVGVIQPPCLSFILFLLLSYSLPFLKRCALPKAYQSPWRLPLLLSYTPEAYSFSYHLCLPYPLSLLAFPPQAHGHRVRSHTFTLTLSFPPQPKAGKGALLSSHAPSPHFLFAPRLRVTWLLSPLPHSVCSG